MPPRFGGRKQGPDLSWEDADIPDVDQAHVRATSPPSNIPGPLFPPRTNIRTPRPLDAHERTAVAAQLRFRASCRDGPLFAVLDKTRAQGADGKPNRRAGFDPFDGQERYSTRHLKKKQRTEPDLSKTGRGDYGYTLRLFPQELWGVLDPEQTLPEWKDVGADSVAVASLGRRAVRRKRKTRRERGLNFDTQDRELLANGIDEEGGQDSDGEDEDPVRLGKRRRKEQRGQEDLTEKGAGQRKGMDAEDEFEAYPQENVEDEDAEDDSLVDSDFSESEGDAPDYQAEGYFDAGDEEDYDGGGGGGDDGGGDY